MQIQKFRHACLVLAKDGSSLVIDPGIWTTDFKIPENVVGIVITHEHADHFDLDKIRLLVETYPELCIFAHVDIIAQLSDISVQKQAVKPGDAAVCGPFSLGFTGGEHLSIHPDFPVSPNLGVLVDNGALYYPGDSFALPGCAVETLAVPASAPWLKTAEAMDFITAIKPKRCFPTHDAILSDEGKGLAGSWLEKAAAGCGSKFENLSN